MENSEIFWRHLPLRVLCMCVLALMAGCDQQQAKGAATSAASQTPGGGVATEQNARPPAQSPSIELPGVESASVQAAVKGMMDAAYGAGKYDAAKTCWVHSFETPNDTLDYCMKPAPPKVVGSADGAQVYLLAYNDPAVGMYSQVDPGLMGLMAASLKTDGGWTGIASSAAIDVGQAGDCACRDAELVKAGPSTYGWLSLEGGLWQGVAVKQYVLLVPVGGAFKDIAQIPQTTEASGEERNTVEIDPQGAVVAGMYPMVVQRKRGNVTLESKTILFDAQKGMYPRMQ